MTGAQTMEETYQLYNEGKKIFSAASMNLREWASNSEELMRLILTQDKADSSGLKVLGITWNLKDDLLSIPGPSSKEKLEKASQNKRYSK